jgi:hypothetical protein
MIKTNDMKKLFLSIVLILSLVFLFAQRSEEKELKSLMKEQGYSWSETKNLKLGDGESLFLWRTFYSGNEYAIVVFTEDENVYDLDLYLHDTEDALIYTSATEGAFEMIEFSPSDVSQFKVLIHNYSSSPEQTDYKCKFMIFYK